LFRNGGDAGESERQMVTCNPEEASVYYDAAPQVPSNNPPENDSSLSHPIGDGNNQQLAKSIQPAVFTAAFMGEKPDLIPNGDIVRISNRGDAPEEKQEESKPTESPVDSPNMALSPTHTSLALGGCTPGLRRRREASEKYATSIAELGLRFQRRRRHFAGSCSASGSSERESVGESRECTPLIDTANTFQS